MRVRSIALGVGVGGGGVISNTHRSGWDQSSSWKHTGQSSSAAAAAELPSYKEVLYEDATEEWYAPYEGSGTRGTQLYAVYAVYRERFFTYVLFHSLTYAATYLERYLLHIYYTSQLDNDEDDKEVDQLELEWVTWQRDYMQNRAWCKSRTCILDAMQYNLVK